MQTFVEFECIDVATFPQIELGSKLSEGLAQVAIMSNSCPFPNLAFDAFRNVLHVPSPFVWLTKASVGAAHGLHRPPAACRVRPNCSLGSPWCHRARTVSARKAVQYTTASPLTHSRVQMTPLPHVRRSADDTPP